MLSTLCEVFKWHHQTLHLLFSHKAIIYNKQKALDFSMPRAKKDPCVTCGSECLCVHLGVERKFATCAFSLKMDTNMVYLFLVFLHTVEYHAIFNYCRNFVASNYHSYIIAFAYLCYSCSVVSLIRSQTSLRTSSRWTTSPALKPEDEMLMTFLGLLLCSFSRISQPLLLL